MAPTRGRGQPVRKAAVNSQGLPPEVISRRTKRHLDELEKSNYSETTAADGREEGEEGTYTKGRARQTISDKRKVTIPGTSPAATSKKSTMNVRSALLYRKNFATLLEESNIASLPPNAPSYLTASAPSPTYPPRLLCSVCGYWGAYQCRRCAMGYCDRNCESVHNETRCERRVT
ncbi:hypothetical protein EST38_g1552 [Candolleomyces aberdarensis]|uniref:Uncharacterized protein n=1 Tax=Candolleomyces aberdarensis TaxID=2316362 RepID=A0A4Q2DYA0_9AGAR|nr:hypothetical protein EST38_g1552 [Candolleomyces aberdarensis]